MGLGIFYYTPLSFYFQPSYWKFKKMCKMKYDFYEKGIGNEDSIDNYKKENGFNNIATWYSGRYYPTIHALLYGLKWDKSYINCTDFYNKWDKD